MSYLFAATSPVIPSCKLLSYDFCAQSSCAGSKSHKSQRVDHYGEPYQPGDVIGCHIALFEDSSLNNMSFYRNGVDQGVAYRGAEIPAGIYFPAVSLYMKVRRIYIVVYVLFLFYRFCCHTALFTVLSVRINLSAIDIGMLLHTLLAVYSFCCLYYRRMCG